MQPIHLNGTEKAQKRRLQRRDTKTQKNVTDNPRNKNSLSGKCVIMKTATLIGATFQVTNLRGLCF